jgi:signal transduction histidine kinase/ActR/RegA family two-component response regulator
MADKISAETEGQALLAPELDEERQGQRMDATDGERQRRVAQAMEQLVSALLGSASVDAGLSQLLDVFIHIVPSDVAVLRLREIDGMRSRAAVGVEEEVAAKFCQPIDEALVAGIQDERAALFSVFPAESGWGSEFIRRKGIVLVYAVPLLRGDDLVGVICLGARVALALSDDQKHLLSLLAPLSAKVVQRLLDDDTLRQGVRAREDVLGVVAHDLRNPINVIALAATSLLHRLPDFAARRPVERIIRSAQHADRLIHGLLEIHAIEGGRFSINSQPVETADVILGALESQQSIAAEASIIISTDLSPELPSIEADEERLLEVLENLVGNAIKFTSPGGSVTVGASARGREVLFWVKDTGAGIPSADLPYLFDRFWQARKKDRRGLGLGLTICKAIVEAHGGRLWPKTQAGKGTTMFFTIPAIARRPRADRAGVANILLVDDRPENLLSLRAILERPDYRLVTATSGEEALRFALRENFAVALIDIAMPGMNGLDVAVHLKNLERSREIPIIFVTAFGDDPHEIHRAYSAGGADYLVKPLDSEIVRKKVAVFVDLSRRRESNGHPVNNGPSDI